MTEDLPRLRVAPGQCSDSLIMNVQKGRIGFVLRARPGPSILIGRITEALDTGCPDLPKRAPPGYRSIRVPSALREVVPCAHFGGGTEPRKG